MQLVFNRNDPREPIMCASSILTSQQVCPPHNKCAHLTTSVPTSQQAWSPHNECAHLTTSVCPPHNKYAQLPILYDSFIPLELTQTFVIFSRDVNLNRQNLLLNNVGRSRKKSSWDVTLKLVGEIGIPLNSGCNEHSVPHSRRHRWSGSYLLRL